MSKITITILGTTAGVPTKERAHAAIHLCHSDREEFCCLFDCGEGTQRQFLKAGINMMKLDNIFITHWHGDHCLGLPGMVDTMGFEGRERPLTVYAPMAKKVKRCLGFSSSVSEFKVIPRNVPSGGGRITTLLDAGRFRMVSTPVNHGVPAVAYALIEKDRVRIDPERARARGLPGEGKLLGLLRERGEIIDRGKRITLEEVSVTQKGRKVVYSGDTEICGNLREMAKDADLLIQDCTYFADEAPERQYMHPSLTEVMDMVSSEKVKRAVLTHISRKYQDTGELKKMVSGYPDVEVAEDFMRIDL